MQAYSNQHKSILLDLNLNINEWVCTEDGEGDHVVERSEVRVKGRKPLVNNNPFFSKLIFVTQQYLNCSLNITNDLIKRTVLNLSEPFTISAVRP